MPTGRGAAPSDRRPGDHPPRPPSLSGSASSPVLSKAGGSSVGTPTSTRSGRSRTGGLGRSSSEAYLDDIPEHMRGVCRFPVVDKDLLTARVKQDPEGRVPKVSFRREEVRALWWPMRGTYTKYHPEFKFEDPPDWVPEDILKPRRRR